MRRSYLAFVVALALGCHKSSLAAHGPDGGGTAAVGTGGSAALLGTGGSPRAGTGGLSGGQPAGLGGASSVLVGTGGDGGTNVARYGDRPGRESRVTPTIDFGVVTVGTTSPPQTVTLTHIGSSSTGGLGVKGLGSYTLFARTDSTCLGPLSPGASCTFKVSFAPTAAEAKTAAYTIGDGTTSWTIILSGTGAP